MAGYPSSSDEDAIFNILGYHWLDCFIMARNQQFRL